MVTLNFGLDIVDGIGGFDLEGDGFAREGLDEDLHDGLECPESVSEILNTKPRGHT